ncbi:hypothetical protein UT300012_32970 [Paraclostridium bifermentans]
MKRYILFNCDAYDGCRGADGIVKTFNTKEELVEFVKNTDLEEDTISIYDALNEIAYDDYVIWVWDENYEYKEYDNEDLDAYLNGIK